MVPKIGEKRDDESDVELIRSIQKGDRDAFAELFHTHYSDLCKFIMQYTSAPDVAEDLIQDVFLIVWRRRSKLACEGSIRSYLYTAARNMALNYLRDKKIERAWIKESQFFDRSYENPTASKLYDRESFCEFEEAVEKAIEQLPERRKLIFSLSRDNGLTYQEIAEVLDISVKTVETQISRSKKTLRKLLVKYLPIIVFLVF